MRVKGRQRLGGGDLAPVFSSGCGFQTSSFFGFRFVQLTPYWPSASVRILLFALFLFVLIDLLSLKKDIFLYELSVCAYQICKDSEYDKIGCDDKEYGCEDQGLKVARSTAGEEEDEEPYTNRQPDKRRDYRAVEEGSERLIGNVRPEDD